MTRLLQLAPPNSRNMNHPAAPPTVPFRSQRAQTILMSHYVDSPVLTNIQKREDNSKPLPWPMRQSTDTTQASATARRAEFLEQSREELCLEIASGSARFHAAQWIKSSKRRPDVLLPGSLRERGEFCVVHVGLVPADSGSSSTSRRKLAATEAGQFTWRVLNVDFHRLDEYPDDDRVPHAVA